ncbi:NAD(P)-binding protein (plasmid) [Pseudoalteromonas espejiana]
MRTKIAIIGGGLSGLYAAYQLEPTRHYRLHIA